MPVTYLQLRFCTEFFLLRVIRSAFDTTAQSPMTSPKSAKPVVYISDLTHTVHGISANTYPLGSSYVFAYAKSKLGDLLDFNLFKFPDDLSSAINSTPPDVLCFSAYSWNLEISYKFAEVCKKKFPKTAVLFGGPNFPTDEQEKFEFLNSRPAIDFFIELEGEYGVEDTLVKLFEHNFDVLKLKKKLVSITNTTYLVNNKLITGPQDRIQNVNDLPSPYLSGALDKFFDTGLIPMLETTRGCPFTCAYCADGLKVKSKIYRYESTRTEEELNYIAKRVENSSMDDLVITDLNFGMYKEDLVTASYIAEIQKLYSYPKRISAASGKNVPKRITEVASMIKGWSPGGSIQSSDKEVLKAVKRSNLSLDAYKQVIVYLNNLEEAKSETEIILALPNDTKAKHFDSIRFAIENQVKSLRIFQAIMLVGTEMASPDYRLKYGLKTSFRILPGTVGEYNICGEKHAAPEVEEIITGTEGLNQNEYVDCRIMDLIVSTVYNNSIFEEIAGLLEALNISYFDLLNAIYENIQTYSDNLSQVIDAYKVETLELFSSQQEAFNFASHPANIANYLNGTLGTNELLVGKARLFQEFETLNKLLFHSTKTLLEQKGLLTDQLNHYIDQLSLFVLLRKNNILDLSADSATQSFDFDFEYVMSKNFRIRPDELLKSHSAYTYKFFHEPSQKSYIESQLKTWELHSFPLGKLLQNANLNFMYRKILAMVSV